MNVWGRLAAVAVFGLSLFAYAVATGRMQLVSATEGPSDQKRYHLVPILCFHNIDGGGPYSLSRQEFRHYLQQIRDEGVRVIPLRTLLEHARSNRLMREPSLVITIDDDYKNIVRVAAPLLREFGYPATFFFYTKDIYKHPRSGTSWEDLRRLHEEGFEIQSHSYSHTAFHKPGPKESLGDWEKRVRRELLSSRLALEKHIPGLDVYAFAYPMGFHTEALEKRLQKYRYQLALTTDARPVDLSRPFRFVFDRYTIQKKYVKNPVRMFERQLRYATRPFTGEPERLASTEKRK